MTTDQQLHSLLRKLVDSLTHPIVGMFFLQDVAFEIGRFYYGIRDYANALKFYRSSSDNIGEHHVTWHNMGLCYYSMGKLLA